MKSSRYLSACAVLVVVSTIGSSSSDAAVMGSANISNGSIGTIDLDFNDNLAPITINELSTVTGSPTGTILGIVKVFGTSGGIFNVGTFGQETHDNEARFHFSDTITNTGPTDQNVALDFLINAGELETIVRESAPASGEFLEAGFEISILFDGLPVFQSSALLRQVGSGPFDTSASITLAGTGLGGVLTNPRTGAPDQFLYTWDAFDGMADLGVLGAGESGLLRYDVRTFGRSEFGSCLSGCGATRARIGDPFDTNGDPLDDNSSIGGPATIVFPTTTTTIPTTTTPPQIPEPASLGLVALGLALLVRRRRAGVAE